MKFLFLFFFLFIGCAINIMAQAPTFADLPGPEHVLVVYKLPDPNNPADTISRAVKDYYKIRRGIPESNIVPLENLSDEWLTYGGTTHRIEIVQSGDIIKDTTQAWEDRFGTAGATFHAWQYFYNYIAEPIKEHLVNNNLTSKIRYIVLCKIPYKIQSRSDRSGIFDPPNKNVSLQSLLSILNNEPYHTTLETLFFGYIDRSNPYYEAVQDNFWYLDYRFLPDFYINSAGLKLSYLVTRLDGLNYQHITQMIDDAVNADTSGLRTWILDWGLGYGPSLESANILSALDFEVYYDDTPNFITDNQLYNNNEVICYSSGGHNSQMPEGYIQNLLQFTYAPGAVFNTFESFNGNSFGEIKRRSGHGLLTEYILMGGTGGICHPWEPAGVSMANVEIFFPAYALGYNLVDAIYMSLSPSMLFQNAIAGDPLTRIYEVYNTNLVLNDTTITSGNIEERIIVPAGVTLRVSQGSIVNFKRNAVLQVEGNIIIEDGSELHFGGISLLSVKDAVFNNSVIVDFSDYSRFMISGELTLHENFVLNLFDSSKMILDETGNIIYSPGVVLNAVNSSTVVLNNIVFNENFSFNFNDQAKLKANNITVEEGANLNFFDLSLMDVQATLKFDANAVVNNMSRFNCGTLIINSGAEVHLQGNAYEIYNGLNISGNSINPVNLYFPNQGTLRFFGFTECYVNFCNIIGGGFFISHNIQGLNLITFQNVNFNNSAVPISTNTGDNILINRCSFNNCDKPIIIHKSNISSNVELNNLLIDNFGSDALDLLNINNLLIDSCTISNGNNGIFVRQTNNDIISHNNIISTEKGITVGQVPHIEDQDILNIISIENNTIQADRNGVIFNETNFVTVRIIDNNVLITTFDPTISTVGINIGFNEANFLQNTFIKGNSITSGNIAMQLTNGSNLTILDNIITNSEEGIILSNINNLECIGNIISSNEQVNYSGIFLNSSSGNLRSNYIFGYNFGLWFANSSPSLAMNIVYNNKYNGIYIGEGSSPYMNRYFHQVSGCDNLIYAFSGFNRIYENGGYTNYPEDDGSEIYFFRSYAFMSNGCNTIADNREPDPPIIFNTQTLLNGSLNPTGSAILRAEGNYWGYNSLYGGNNPRSRFGNLSVNYDPYLTDPCTAFLEGYCGWIITDRTGSVLDTLYPVASSGQGSELDLLYSQGDNYFLYNQLNEAKNVYTQIVSIYGVDIQSINAYIKLLNIALLQNLSPEELEQLRIFYIQNSSSTQDSTLKYMLEQLSRLTLVAKGEYQVAIEVFDGIVQQYPGTEKALYAEIDAYTTALLLDENGFGKTSKYSLNGVESYGNKVNSLLKSYIKGEYQSNSHVIPIEFTLYQNYPNPFNPTTTIKYDLPNASDASLIVYDILGRKVKELVNTKQEAGRYEVQFNASTLTSGVYIYQLIADKYINSKKMILLK